MAKQDRHQAEAFGFYLDDDGYMRRTKRRRKSDVPGDDILSIVVIIIAIAQVSACAAFPNYRQVMIDVALWGWNLIF